MDKLACARFIPIVLFAFFSAGSSYAVEWLTEFQSLTESEEALFEGPRSLGPEYQSHLLNYTKPTLWEYLWLKNPTAFDLSIGSVSAAHFLIENRLKIHRALSDSVEFRFAYFEERNRERDSVHHILELVFWPWKKIGISMYGEPSLYKREDDTGLALILKPNDTHEIRIFNTFVDVTRLRRNDRNDTYVEPFLPYSRGLVGRWWNEAGDFFEYAARYETRTRWLFPDQLYEYDYWKLFGSLFWSREINPRLRLNGRLQWDRKFESKVPTTLASLVSAQTWRTDRFFVTLQGVFHRVVPNQNWELAYGVQYAYRRWETDMGSAIYRDILPHARLTLPAFGSGAIEDHLSVGYDLTWHRVFGSREILDRDDVDGALEHRLNLEYEFNFGEKAKLKLVATGDLDEFLTSHMWEGGSGQFQVVF